jgi:hypothetical protein
MPNCQDKYLPFLNIESKCLIRSKLGELIFTARLYTNRKSGIALAEPTSCVLSNLRNPATPVPQLKRRHLPYILGHLLLRRPGVVNLDFNVPVFTLHSWLCEVMNDPELRAFRFLSRFV